MTVEEKENNPAVKKTVQKVKRADPNIPQRMASDPNSSVWVTASAGTGKTKVLTDRVLRLMLEGNAPENILCITFTNAGASVMQNRIRETLSEWSSCDNRELSSKLFKLTGKRANAAQKKKARQLFTEFLDSSGGMKIQTIHSFSQSLLKRFPIETGIPPYFDVMDEQTSQKFLKDAQANILNHIEDEPNSKLAKAVRMITPEVTEEEFVSLIGELTYRRGELYTTFEEQGGLDNVISGIFKYLNAPENTTSNDIRLNICENINEEQLYKACKALEMGTKTDKDRAEELRYFLDNKDQRVSMLSDYTNIFLTADGSLRKRLSTKKSFAAQDILVDEGSRILAEMEKIKTINIANGTSSLMILADAILQDYAEQKKAKNLLDYDDLIHKTVKLLKEDDATSWVLQKLDGNLEHILVDEAQDTNPDQWQIIAEITKEFFNGDMVTEEKQKNRTMFVVGDEKQSIFSFQRADPKEFARRRNEFREQVEKAGNKWSDVEMEITFRSAPAIMEAVDAVFKQEEASNGLYFDDKTEIKHDAFRRGQSGLVEIHPVTTPKEMDGIEKWSLPIKREEENNPAVDMAEKIADQIKDWLDKGEKLKARGREISPSDIMILVRRRSEFVDHMVRSLKKRNIPVSGADRMSLSEQLAVQDLKALGEFLISPSDDYKLATILKSPLFGMDDADLEKIAIERTGTLFDSLREYAENDNGIFKESLKYIDELINKIGHENPYEFYSDVLMKHCPASEKSGLFAMYQRLGFDAEDPIVEFMNALENFEKNNTPSMQGFLKWLDIGKAEIKREMSFDSSNPKINIMTVHGAKGLEAPIVFMPDTTSIPSNNTKTKPKLLWPNSERKIPLWVPRSNYENALFVQEREKVELERDQEYRRLLYVAMTRAADRLYVYGSQTGKNRPEDCWYDLISNGLNTSNDLDLKTKEIQIDKNKTEKIISLEGRQRARIKKDGKKLIKKKRKVAAPIWARTMPVKELTITDKFNPSNANKKQSNSNKTLIKRTISPLQDNEDSYHQKLGNAVHQLLESLPHIPKSEQANIINEYLNSIDADISKSETENVSKNILNVLNDDKFKELFTENSKAEVNISGYINRQGRKELISGQIDRLVVNDDTVLILDYKNGQKIPQKEQDISDDYIMQIASYKHVIQEIYPDKQVKCALLWTRNSSLQEISDKRIDSAVKKIGLQSAKTLKL